MMLKQLALALALLPGTSFAQQTIVVDPTGAGDYLGLQEAVDAASPGDTILIIQSQEGPREITIDKGITVVGLGPDHGGGRVSLNRLNLHSIPSGQTVAILNLSFRLEYVGFDILCPWISITDCDGSIFLENSKIDRGRISITNCRFVSLAYCEGIPGDAVSDGYCLGGSVWVDSSSAILSNCKFAGFDACCGVFCGNGSSSAASFRDSQVTMIDCTLRGGNGSSCLTPLPSSPAAIVSSSQTRVCGGSFISGFSSVGGAPRFRGTGQLFVGDDQNLCAGLPPEIDCANVLMPCIWSSRLFLGDPVEVEMTGPPGGLAILLISRPAGPTATPFGDLWIDFAWTRTLYAGPVGPSGVVAGRIAAVPLGLPLGERFMVQGAAFDGSRMGLSMPVPLLVN